MPTGGVAHSISVGSRLVNSNLRLRAGRAVSTGSVLYGRNSAVRTVSVVCVSSLRMAMSISSMPNKYQAWTQRDANFSSVL